MKKTNNWKIGIIYSKWYYLALLIVMSSLLIGYLFSLVMNLDFTLVNVFLRSIFSTAIIWGGCVSIVTYTWIKFPWESMPIKHLIVEILLILSLLSIYIISGAVFISYKNESSININDSVKL